MLHLCKCHETNVVDLWPLEGRDGWVCPVNLTDRERSEDGQAASLVLPLGGPSSLFCCLISYFFPAKKRPSFPAEPKKIDLKSRPLAKMVSAEHQFASWLEKNPHFFGAPKIPLELWIIKNAIFFTFSECNGRNVIQFSLSICLLTNQFTALKGLKSKWKVNHACFQSNFGYSWRWNSKWE